MTHFKARNLTALLLVLILLVSMFSPTALAAEDEYITDFEAESEIIIEEEPTEELPEAEESSEEVPEIEESSEVSDTPTSGTIPGSNIQWELTDDGMLLISGSGGCAAFSSAADQPWAAVREQITSVFFEDPSLLSIYDLAYWFDGCVSLTTAEIPYTTPVIGTHAFYGCVSLTTVMTYYGDSVLAEIGADAFYLPYDSGSTLYIGYLIGYPESTVPLHTYDWTGSNRSSLYFMDVYSTNALTSVVGACPSCGKQSLQETYVAQSHTSRGHAEYYECYLCHYTKYLGSYVYKNHGSGSYGSWTCPSCGSHSWVLDYESDATCTRNGYREYSCDCGQSKRETVYATGHNYSYGSWEQYSSSQHRRENYCRYCGATDYDYASHSYSYGSWSSAGSSQHSRSMTCRYCGYSDTQYASHSLSYGSWSSHSDTQHRRTGSCTTCSYSTTDYGAHTFSYPSEDSDMLAAEAQYCAMEAELQSKLDTYEATHDYDEYHFDLGEIGHDPYVLISALTALKGGAWTLDEVQSELQMLFDKQYILTETVETEIRYRLETRYDEDGNPYTVQVPYEYTICTVTLENFDLSHVPVYVMSEDQLALYASYMATLGNRPDLFGDSDYVNRYYGNGSGGSYDIPPEALEDEAFAAIIKEAEKYLGFPYVWGGSSPATSFDCSGFVSYVYNNCGVGWIFGRLSAEGIRQICSYVSPADAKPGDLIFFEKTYNTTGASHIGIYVGNHTMLHCGDPIQYTSISSDYWQSHFLQFGRLAPP